MLNLTINTADARTDDATIWKDGNLLFVMSSIN